MTGSPGLSMDIDRANTNNSNRRSAFRIYEQVNLFYHKIEYNQNGKTKPDFNNITDNVTQSLDKSPPISNEAASPEDFLPESHSQENDTLNVNISASGISFTCKEELIPGDYLVIRLLLLSSMTVITAYCKVVHFKLSNPFEINQYPYLVGARFVNLKSDDKELLNRHINKRRTRHFIADGLFVSLIMLILAIPDVILDLLVQLSSFLFDNFIGTIHLFYELIEYSLDHLVEQVFHTSLHETELIAFYIQVVLGFVGLYILLRIITSAYKKSARCCRVFFHRKKLSVLYYWGEQSLLYKFGMISTGIITIFCYGLFFI
jgi:hypothetical protein